ncbi:MAG: tRNA 2-thiocytidine(32) synthetase TtcA, partial [Halomonas sp.]
TNIAPSQLADRSLFDFEGLEAKQAELLAGRIQAFNVS